MTLQLQGEAASPGARYVDEACILPAEHFFACCRPSDRLRHFHALATSYSVSLRPELAGLALRWSVAPPTVCHKANHCMKLVGGGERKP